VATFPKHSNNNNSHIKNALGLKRHNNDPHQQFIFSCPLRSKAKAAIIFVLGRAMLRYFIGMLLHAAVVLLPRGGSK